MGRRSSGLVVLISTLLTSLGLTQVQVPARTLELRLVPEEIKNSVPQTIRRSAYKYHRQ